MATETPAVAVYRPGLLDVGLTGVICRVEGTYVVKYPNTSPGNGFINEMRLEQMATERQIYERLGPHEGIIPYHGLHDDEGAIKLTYANQGDLEQYIRTHAMPSQSLRAAWIRSIINAFNYTYSRKTLHQDVKLNNILYSH